MRRTPIHIGLARCYTFLRRGTNISAASVPHQGNQHVYEAAFTILSFTTHLLSIQEPPTRKMRANHGSHLTLGCSYKLRNHFHSGVSHGRISWTTSWWVREERRVCAQRQKGDLQHISLLPLSAFPAGRRSMAPQIWPRDWLQPGNQATRRRPTAGLCS